MGASPPAAGSGFSGFHPLLRKGRFAPLQSLALLKPLRGLSLGVCACANSRSNRTAAKPQAACLLDCFGAMRLEMTAPCYAAGNGGNAHPSLRAPARVRSNPVRQPSTKAGVCCANSYGKRFALATPAPLETQAALLYDEKLRWRRA